MQGMGWQAWCFSQGLPLWRFFRKEIEKMTGVIRFCDVIENCEDCPNYGDVCDGRGDEDSTDITREEFQTNEESEEEI